MSTATAQNPTASAPFALGDHYCACVVADYGWKDFPGEYSPWFVAHKTESALSPERIAELWDEYTDEEDDDPSADGFFGWLEEEHPAYTVFRTAVVPVVPLPVDGIGIEV